MMIHSQSRRKELGAYYTPLDLSQILTNWAITSPSDHILEPSFGGCGFLEACIESLKSLSSKNPTNNIFGVDIDSNAFNFLSNKLGTLININENRFIESDFLNVNPTDFNVSKFDVVVGNPPYVSHHNMSEEQRESCNKVIKDSPFVTKSLGTHSSLWAYFVIHSLSFLKDGGRIAWVLPSSLLYSKYSKEVLKIYREHFDSIKLIKLHERYFQDSGTNEVSIVLLASNFSHEPHKNCVSTFQTAKNINYLEACISKKISLNSNENYKLDIIDKESIRDFISLENSESSSKLSGLCKTQIGLVTGDNSKFIINKTTLVREGITASSTKPIVSRFSQLDGIIHTKKRHEKLIERDSRCFLVCPENLESSDISTRKYFESVSTDQRTSNKTFAKRQYWFNPDDGKSPDAFLSCMLHGGPRMVINISGYNCTNSIYRVYFKKDIEIWKRKALALSMYSSFSQLSAEIEGKSYGSGVLKLEPSSASRISIITDERVLVELYNNMPELVNIIENNQIDLARNEVDEIIRRILCIDREIIKNFEKCIEILRNDRYKIRKTSI